MSELSSQVADGLGDGRRPVVRPRLVRRGGFGAEGMLHEPEALSDFVKFGFWFGLMVKIVKQLRTDSLLHLHCPDFSAIEMPGDQCRPCCRGEGQSGSEK